MSAEILNSDDLKYNGTGNYMNGELKSEAVGEDGRENSIALNVPPLGCVVMKGNDY